MSTAIYNEIDPFAAAWLRNLVERGHITPGAVDERSVADLTPDAVAGPGQRHFFAGIGGWSYALRLAGWPDDVDVWTGSCPCQPFSAAGRRGGFDDERHLWPAWFALIQQCRPAIVFGEQVASPDGLKWLDAVRADLEAAGYAFGASDLCAAGVGAPHIRQRLYFVALADGQRLERLGVQLRERGSLATVPEAGGRGSFGSVADDERDGLQGRIEAGPTARTTLGPGDRTPWDRCDWLHCRDGKVRPVEPGTFPLAYGVPARMGRLRGYGNAIVPQVAATFVQAVIEALWL